MIKVELTATNIEDLKTQLQLFLGEQKITNSVVKIAPLKAEEEPKKAKATKKAEELTEDQKAELRTLCAEYMHKVADGKERIKAFLKDKGLGKVTELKPADLPEFKAMVQI